MDYNNVSFFVESCQLLFENKLSWIFCQLIYFYDNKKNYFFENLCIIIKLIILFICYEYKAVIEQLIISSHHFLIVEIASDTADRTSWFNAHHFTKNSYFTQFLSAHLNYIPKICVILAAITMNFFRFFKDGVFSKNQFVWKKHFFYH